MTLLRGVDGDMSWSDWSMLSVGDVEHRSGARAPDDAGDEFLGRYAGYSDGRGLTGTIARAGEGWLQGAGSWRRTAVRLELHTAVPAIEDEPWCEAVETPYVSRTGSIALYGPDDLKFELDGFGTYRVRVLLRREDEWNRWCLRFWRTSGPVEPPRWLARSASAIVLVPADWRKVLPGRVWWLYQMVRMEAAGTDAPISLERAAVRYVSFPWPRHRELEEGWLEADLWTVPEPLPTGHADLDRKNRHEWREATGRTAKKKNKWRRLSERLGVPLPANLRESFTLLVAAGLLHADAEGYRVAATPPTAGDILGLSPKKRAKYAKRRHHVGHLSLAGDVHALAAWSPGHAITGTAAEFAERLLISIEDFHSVLPHVREEEFTTMRTGPDDPITLTARSRRKDREDRRYRRGDDADEHDPFDDEDAELLQALDAQQAWHEWPADDATLPPIPDWAEHEDSDPEGGWEDRLAEAKEFFERQDSEEQWKTPRREYPEAGAEEFGSADPPKAGLFRCDGRVIVWRGGEPQTLGRTVRRDLTPKGSFLRDGPDIALETPYGIVLAAFDKNDFEDWWQARLVQQDGTVCGLGGGIRTLQRSCDGRNMAISTQDDEVRLVDLADGSTQTMPGLENDRRPEAIGIFAGQVYVNRSSATKRPYPQTWRWRPGQAPEQLDVLLQWVDPVTGTALAARKDGRLLIAADGTTRRLPIDPSARLAPGGRLLYTMRRDPHALTFFDVHDLGRNPRIVRLPPDCDPRYFGGPDMVWEDTRHLLIPSTDLSGAPRPSYRLDVQTGRLERLPVYGRQDDIPLFVQPVF
ncbi:DUF6042 family protein [Actinocorallia populi]|uniref:DUF6042 family protein n=1 Tax=Actinocorallia populi TaxID=2079200 RepID=UPI00130096B1|nr:DUF6042 family protein [Actinocorallia populi]